jgi:polygalacturonase
MTRADIPTENQKEDQNLSRRNWLGIAVPVVAASVGAELLAGRAMADDQPTAGASDEKLIGAKTYNVRDFGAKGDGATLDTAAVQAAIDACNKDQGGTVLVPAGVFVIGTVEMKSNVTLRVAAQGKLLGSGDGKQYHAADGIPLTGDATLGDGNVGLIFAVKAENISIEGPGTIDGNGALFHPAVRGTPPPSGRGGNKRPYHVLLHQCKNVRIRDIYLVACAYHSVRVIQSSYVNFDGIHIYNRVNGNNDGFHFISSQHVHISNCDVECQDDACAMFGSCKFITITNSSFSTRWAVFRFGGGEAENVTISNCLIHETYGCPIKMRCGPDSRFENISFSNLVMSSVNGPIDMELGPQSTLAAHSGEDTSQTKQKPGIFRNISFNGIRATVVNPLPLPGWPYGGGYRPGENKTCIVLNGVDAYLENISFNDVHITFPGGGTAAEAAVRNVPKIGGQYFELGILPAYALYARKVRGLTMSNVRFEVASPDLRPALAFDQVEDAAVNGMSAQGDKDATSVLRFTDSRDVLLSASRVLTPAAVFLQVEGGGSEGITVDGGDISKAASALAFKNGADEKSVKLRA